MDLAVNVSRGRCAAVWSVITIVAAAVLGLLLPSLKEATAVARAGGLAAAGFEPALVWVCAAAAAASTCWLWAVTSVTVLDTVLDTARDTTLETALDMGPARRGVPAGVRRLVLVLCGAALTTGLAAPALAGGQGPARPHVLAGLRLPERVAVVAEVPEGVPGGGPRGLPREVSSDAAAGQQATSVAPTVRPRVVVGPGDTLWSISAEALGSGASEDAIAASWPEVYELNRVLIGPDPDLIEPGQGLLLPLPETDGAGR